MSKSKIEWCDYTVNPVKGLCPSACPYCYARAMYHRFKWDGTIKFEYAKFRKELESIKKPSRIFVGSTMELFGDWIENKWMQFILEATQLPSNRKHTFIFLTKQPQNLIGFDFPDNCYVGVSWTGKGEFGFGFHIEKVKAKLKFISFEPLLARHSNAVKWDEAFKRMGIGWAIIGQQTPIREATTPKIEWITEIVQACDRAGIPVFLKNNLAPLFTQASKGLDLHTTMERYGWALNKESGLRQEMSI